MTIIITYSKTSKFKIKKNKKTFRYFNSSYYYDSNKWLSGCEKSQKLFCWLCILFSRKSNVWSKFGFDDLNNYYNLKHRHETNRIVPMF
ncbi:zinc finger MYM-type protein 1-like isoform X1 [Aphis craccivora]|uniref:Zinc finger MYM-type protein 1-like isoform X1 n=1 Tax=Aphis craccivora TaxID=307492 RepID=A0A6G0VY97_APHCR|nr:zinc finger MYM-type protein 1-like isoform X1 [Aphis craccivora]